jgi:hypothetical protein
MDHAVNINKYLPVAILYFFFNSFLLPLGLLYTTLLTPLFILWLYKFPSFKFIWLFFPVMAPFVLIHFLNGVNVNYYIRSFLLCFSVYVFAITFYRFLKECHTLRTLFKNLILINAIFLVVALMAFFLPSLGYQFWFKNEITAGIMKISRLRMLTYEPSYYSTLLAPIAIYYYLKLLILKLPSPWTIALLVSVPILLSLSFGVILGLTLTFLFTFLFGFKTLFPNKSLVLYIIIGGIILSLLIIAFILLFPENIFVLRMNNVFSGLDTSFKGRTTDSFYLGWKIASQKSIYFGCGLGQVKEVGLDIFREFYNYPAFTTNQIGIPNAVGDTLATFGLVGVGLRMGAEIYLFFKTKVFTNFYRLSLFLFIFIYQFTGSFLTNIAEYVIWIMAFYSELFPEFNKEAIGSEFTINKGAAKKF